MHSAQGDTSSPRSFGYFLSARWLGVFAFVIYLGYSWLHNTSLFRLPIYEGSDDAIDSLAVNRAVHFHQLVGQYSRVGFSHPGPAQFYIEGAGRVLFYNMLHLVPGQFNGELLGLSVYYALVVALVVAIVRRATSSVLAAVIIFSGLFSFFAAHGYLIQAWPPDVHRYSFLLFVVAGAALLAGEWDETPSYVLAAGMLVHGHVSFIGFVGATTVVIGGCALVRRHKGRAGIAAGRTARVTAIVIAVVLTLPIVLELMLHFPGYWSKYWHYTMSPPHNAPRTIGQVCRFVGYFWHADHIPAPIALILVLLAIILTYFEQRTCRRFFLALYTILLLQCFLFFYYTLRGIDVIAPSNYYVGYFYQDVPMLLAVAVLAQAVMFLAERACTEARPWQAEVSMFGTVLVVLTIVVGVMVSVGRFPSNGYDQGDPSFATAVSFAERAADGHRIGWFAPNSNTMTPLGGVAIESERRGFPFCIVPGVWSWPLVFQNHDICAPNEAFLTVHITSHPDTPVAAHVLLSEPSYVVWLDPQN